MKVQKNFRDLAKKPLFLQIIFDNYEKIKKEQIVNPAVIFKSLTDKWIDFDVERKNISSEMKIELKDHRQRISEGTMIHSNKKNNSAISKDEIRNQVEEEFKYAPVEIQQHLEKILC